MDLQQQIDDLRGNHEELVRTINELSSKVNDFQIDVTEATLNANAATANANNAATNANIATNNVNTSANNANNAAINANNAAEAIRWKYAGQYIGQQLVSLNSMWSEAYVSLRVDNNSAFCVHFNIIRDEIENAGSSVVQFYREGYYFTATNWGGTTLRAKSSDLYLHQCVHAGADVTANSVWRVYWR